MKRIIFLRGWQSLCPLGQCLFSAQLCKGRHDDQIPIKQAGNFKSLSNRALWEENSGAIIKMICSQCPTCHFRNFLRENWLAQIEYPVMCTNYFERSPLHLLNMKLGQNQMTPSGLSHKYQLKPIYQAILQYILLSQYYFIKSAICHEWPDIKQRQLVQNMITSLTLEMPIRLPHPSLTCSISDKQYILIVWNRQLQLFAFDGLPAHFCKKVHSLAWFFPSGTLLLGGGDTATSPCPFEIRLLA